MSLRQRRLWCGAGVLLVLGPPAAWIAASACAPPSPGRVGPSAVAGPAPVRVAQAGNHAELATRDPMALVRLGRARYDQEIQDYHCTLTKQERLGNKLSAVQTIEVRFRKSPKTVYMIWLQNPDQARRALFMDTPEFVDKHGRKVARVEPAGAVARLFVKDTHVPIDGPEARKSSRRSIEDCGFGATFDLLERYNAVALERGVLDIRYDGTGEVAGRPTHVITRILPYTGPNGPYPDAKMVLHLDQETLLPVAVYSYADVQQQQLLGSYVFSNVVLNPGMGDDAFEF